MANRTLAFTHTSRGMDFAQCSLNYLTRRYSHADRLGNLPPLYSLHDEKHSNEYTGSFTMWEWNKEDEPPILSQFVSKPYKVQDVCRLRGNLLVCSTTFFEVYPIGGPYEYPQKTVTHQWFSGGHTIEVNSLEQIIVSCSGPDSILVFDREGNFYQCFRIPESIYGRNYQFTLDDDLRAHYINNDLQLGHLNSATPAKEGYLCSMLIPGAIGYFDGFGSYREITRGFVGCHGARLSSDDMIYFSDSCNGLLVEMDIDGRVGRRFQLQTKWLHDSLQVSKSLYLFSLSDSNTIELWDVSEEKKFWQINCDGFGETTQFLSMI